MALAVACDDSTLATERAELAFTKWTPDGSDSTSSVWIARRDGSGARQIAEPADEARLSPDGRRLAYLGPQPDWKERLEKGEEPGGGLFIREVGGEDEPVFVQAVAPLWAPDGESLAAEDEDGLLVIDAETGKSRLVLSGDPLSFTFSPDSAELAVARPGKPPRTGGPATDIFVVRVADGHVSQITHDHRSDVPVHGPRWIAFQRFRPQNLETARLYLMRPDGTGARPLGPLAAFRGRPIPLDFSADGKRLLACDFDDGCRPVVIDVPAGTAHRLFLKGELEAKELSADGEEVLVEAGPGEKEEELRIYALPVDGGKPRLLATNASEPSWARGLPSRDDAR